MKEVLLDFLKNNNIEIEGKKIVLGVSTGVDSMSLLNAFIDLRSDINFDIIVCHVNHNKRKESINEEAFIKDYCNTLNIKCYVLSFSDWSKDNFQEEARAKRYEFFYEVMEKENTNMLFLAHHADDLMETILMRIIRGTSLNGYSGFHGVSFYKDKMIIRPFINVEKEKLYEYQKKAGFAYFEDSSNQDNDYTRNKIRHNIIPLIKELENDASSKFYDFSLDMDNSSNIIMGLVHDFINEHIEMNDKIRFNSNDYNKLSLFLKREVLFEVLKPFKLSKKNIEEIDKWISSSKANFKNEYKNIVFLKEYDSITISKINNDITKEFNSVVIDGIGTYKINDNILINVFNNTSDTIVKSNDLCYNIKKLPIVIRPRIAGDKIKLSSGTKKVKDLLIDEKIELTRRDEILVAEDRDKNILCVFGVKKSAILNHNDNDIIIRIEGLE